MKIVDFIMSINFLKSIYRMPPSPFPMNNLLFVTSFHWIFSWNLTLFHLSYVLYSRKRKCFLTAPTYCKLLCEFLTNLPKRTNISNGDFVVPYSCTLLRVHNIFWSFLDVYSKLITCDVIIRVINTIIVFSNIWKFEFKSL